MGITDLNHFLVRANDLEQTKDFYCDVLGFEVMPRPDFPFPGYWLGVKGSIQVHLAQDGVENSELYYIGSPRNAARDHAGVVDHIAFGADDVGGVARRLREHRVPYRPRYFPQFKLYQLFITDPNGLMIELNFYDVASDPGLGGEDYSAMPRSDRPATAGAGS